MSDGVEVFAGADVFVEVGGGGVALGMGEGEAVAVGCVVAVGHEVIVDVGVDVSEAVAEEKTSVVTG